MLRFVLCLAVVKSYGEVFFENFDAAWETRGWKVSSIAKYKGRWDVHEAEDSVIKGEQGLFLRDKARHHAISAPFSSILEPAAAKSIVIQYQVRFHDYLSCGGAYIKVLHSKPGHPFSPATFDNTTVYSIMFGPDFCDTTNKVHLIYQFENPMDGSFTQHHLDNPPAIRNDPFTHLYTLLITPDQQFKIFMDKVLVRTGKLTQGFSPPVGAPAMIDDSTDEKPQDWDDRRSVVDPHAQKPTDWDEDQPKTIHDPKATMPAGWLEDEPALLPDPDVELPDEWDEEEDGEWELPTIANPVCAGAVGCGPFVKPVPNPQYKGKWIAPTIPNPNYRGPFTPRKVPNPNFFEETAPFARLPPMGGVGIELWGVQNGIEFDDIFVGTDIEEAWKVAREGWGKKDRLESVEKRALERKHIKAAKANAPPNNFELWRSSLDKFLIEKQFELGIVAIILSIIVGCVYLYQTYYVTPPPNPFLQETVEYVHPLLRKDDSTWENSQANKDLVQRRKQRAKDAEDDS